MFIRDSIIQAVEKSDLSLVRNLIADGADVNTCNNFGENLLFLAAQKGCQDIVEFLIEQGADLQASNTGGQNAVFAACKGGNIHILKILIELGVDPKKLTKNKSFPLQIAVKYEHLDIIEYFIETKIFSLEEFDCLKLNGVSSLVIKKILDIFFEKFSPVPKEVIHRCFEKFISIDNIDGMDYLLERFSLLQQEIGLFFPTLLNSCVPLEQCSVKAFKKDKINSPILKKYADQIDIYSANQNAVFTYLFKKGLRFETQDLDGQTLLHVAAFTQMDEYENIFLLPYLLKLGYCIDILNKKAQTPLIVAIERGFFFHAIYLIYEGANINLSDAAGLTPLYYAENFSEYGFTLDTHHTEFSIQHNLTLRADLIQLLKDYGANSL